MNNQITVLFQEGVRRVAKLTDFRRITNTKLNVFLKSNGMYYSRNPSSVTSLKYDSFESDESDTRMSPGVWCSLVSEQPDEKFSLRICASFSPGFKYIHMYLSYEWSLTRKLFTNSQHSKIPNSGNILHKPEEHSTRATRSLNTFDTYFTDF